MCLVFELMIDMGGLNSLCHPGLGESLFFHFCFDIFVYQMIERKKEKVHTSIFRYIFMRQVLPSQIG